jgi:hypothetical protein
MTSLFKSRTSYVVTLSSILLRNPTKELKIIYVTSRLTRTALALVNPRLDKECAQAYKKVTELYAYLKELYSNPNCKKPRGSEGDRAHVT